MDAIVNGHLCWIQRCTVRWDATCEAIDDGYKSIIMINLMHNWTYLCVYIRIYYAMTMNIWWRGSPWKGALNDKTVGPAGLLRLGRWKDFNLNKSHENFSLLQHFARSLRASMLVMLADWYPWRQGALGGISPVADLIQSQFRYRFKFVNLGFRSNSDDHC